MKVKMYVDANGNPIDIDTLYKVVKNNVNDIHIIELDGNYFAKLEGLDEELLEGVCNDLVPMFVESEKTCLKKENSIKI